MLIELEDPATACPHIFCFTYRPLGRLVPLVLLDEVPSCPRFACEAPEHTAAHPHRLDQLASCAARARELLSPERSQQQGGHHRRQHAHQEQQPQQLARPLPSLHTPDPRARAPGKQTAVEVHVTAEKDSSPELVYTPYGSMFQQQASHSDLLQQPEGYAAHASGQPSSMQHLPGYQAAAEANAEQAIVTIQPEQQADGSPALRHGSNGNSSATFQPGPSPMQPGSGHTVAVIAPSASLTDVEAEMQVDIHCRAGILTQQSYMPPQTWATCHTGVMLRAWYIPLRSWCIAPAVMRLLAIVQTVKNSIHQMCGLGCCVYHDCVPIVHRRDYACSCRPTLTTKHFGSAVLKSN